MGFGWVRSEKRFFQKAVQKVVIGVSILTAILTRGERKARIIANSLYLQVAYEVGGERGIRTPDTAFDRIPV